MIIVLLLLFLIGYIVVRRAYLSESQIKRQEIVRELKRSGRLRKELDSLHRQIINKEIEIRGSKDRSANLAQEFVSLNAKRQTK